MNNLQSFIPLTITRRGVQRLASTSAPAFDCVFLQGLGRAFYWQKLLDSGLMKSGSEIAKAEGLHHSTVNELLRLTLLAPDIIEMLMAGRQPRRLTLMWFQRNRLPVDWQVQRDIIAQFD
ncbi:site-specific recombinase resolvase [Iodobacter arcticus]|uniref:Site-specific recombinase resolvase n=1 Tax=Iodobacter arcticus TaxID=590593 RepID=A0ABW2R2Q8_9NEIS